MLNYIRIKIALKLAKKALVEIETGDFKRIERGLEYFKWSVIIIPPCKELYEFEARLRETAEQFQTES